MRDAAGCGRRALRALYLLGTTQGSQGRRRARAIRRFASVTGNIVFPGFTAPKLVWVAAGTSPTSLARVAKVLLPKGISSRLHLTGDHVGGCRTAPAPPGSGQTARGGDWSAAWWPRRASGAPTMPRLGRGLRGDRAFMAQRSGRRFWGLPGGSGSPAGGQATMPPAWAWAWSGPGRPLSASDLGGALRGLGDAYQPDLARCRATPFCHALAGRWHPMGVILAARSDA